MNRKNRLILTVLAGFSLFGANLPEVAQAQISPVTRMSPQAILGAQNLSALNQGLNISQIIHQGRTGYAPSGGLVQIRQNGSHFLGQQTNERASFFAGQLPPAPRFGEKFVDFPTSILSFESTLREGPILLNL
jgi:hypothetical protein